MTLKKYFILFSLLLSASAFGQNTTAEPDFRISRLEKIYRNLEYNTISFNDLKQTWIVTDPVFVREIFNRFVVQNALRVNGRKPTVEGITQMSDYIYNGDVFIDLRKRYYDDEIEMLRFFRETREPMSDSTDYFFDPIRDYVAIRGILGDVLYNDLKKQAYALNDITKSHVDYKPAYNFIIHLSLLEPEVMFWSLTTRARNKYLTSFFGKWGNDHVTLPGWYHPNYAFGVRVNYLDSIENNKQGYTYIGEFGIGIPAVQPDLGFDDAAASGRLLENTGSSFYFRFVGAPLREIDSSNSDLELELAGMFSIGTKKASDYHPQKISTIFSTRNYFDFFVNQKNIAYLSDFGALNAGGGISAFDVKYFTIDPAQPQLVITDHKGKNGFKWNLYAQAGVANLGSVVTHSAQVQMAYNVSEKLAMLGFKAYIMLGNTFGIDFRVFTPMQFGSGGLPAYRAGSYLVISPVFRINY